MKVDIHTTAGKVVNTLIYSTAEKQNHVSCVAIAVFMRDLVRNRRTDSRAGNFGSFQGLNPNHSPKVATAKKTKGGQSFALRKMENRHGESWLKRGPKLNKNKHNLRIEVNSTDIEKFKRRGNPGHSTTAKLKKRTMSDMNNIDFSKELKSHRAHNNSGEQRWGFLNQFNKSRSGKQYKYWEKELMKSALNGGVDHVLIVDEGERRKLFN